MNAKIEWISKQIYLFFMKSQIICFPFFSLLQTAINYFTYDLGDDSYYTPYFTAWPFNWRTPIGYLVVLAIELLCDLCARAWFVPTVCFFIGLCWLSVAFAKDITIDLNFLNIGGKSNRSQVKLIKRFCGIVQLYADARQLRQ